jgi:small conductance mechanosensitive channel
MEEYQWLIAYGIDVGVAILILIVGWIIAGFIARKVKKYCDNSEKIDNTLSPLFAKTARFIALAAVLIIVLDTFGIEVASLIAILSVAGLAVGLALQGTLSNVASGIMLLSFRPFDTGDFIQAGGVMGVVDEIGVFVTTLHTVDNIFVMVPNSSVWGGEIRNYSRNDIRRVDLVMGIGYGDDIDKAMDVINRVLGKEQRILADPAPLVAVDNLGDSSVDLIVRPWVKKADWFMTKLDLTKALKLAFDKEGISIPFPQRDVHFFNETPEYSSDESKKDTSKKSKKGSAEDSAEENTGDGKD